MKKSALLIVAIILIAGCAQSQLDTTIKTLPQTKAFLEEFPEATIKAALYSPLAIKNIISKFIDDCPALGEEGKSYYKVTVTDEPSKQQLIVWLDEKDYGFACAIRTSTAGEKVSTTTTSVPTTTTAQSTPSTQSAECSSDATRCSGDLLQSCYNGKWTLGENCAYGCDSSLPSPRCRTSPTTTLSGATTTTTSGGTTTSAAATTTTAPTTTTSGATTTTTATTTAPTTTTSSTTTTTQPKPDLYISSIMTSSNSTYYTFSIVIGNKGSGTYPAPSYSSQYQYRYYIDYYNPSTGVNDTKTFGDKNIDVISPGSSKIYALYYYYAPSSVVNGQYYLTVTADSVSAISESDETNNVRSTSFSKPP